MDSKSMDRKCPRCGGTRFHRRRETRTVQRDLGMYVIDPNPRRSWRWVNYQTDLVDERTYSVSVSCADCGYAVVSQSAEMEMAT